MRQLFCLCLCLNIITNIGIAQESSIRAFKSAQSPVLDGRINEPVWDNATPFSDFKMVEPIPGSKPTERTEVRVLYDKTSLYIAIRCFDSEPGKIAANTMEHDKSKERTEDQVSILLDPFQDKRSAYIFIVNPKGARSEGFANGQTYSLGWDGIWQAKSRIDAEGWTTEIEIPFKTISFNKRLTSWGINVERYIARKQEVIRYSGISLNSFFSNPKEAGSLTGIDSVKQGLGLTFRPYAIGNINANKSDTGSVTGKLAAGFDIYKNITPNLVAAFTYNTDFAETEVDERKINLTRFPLYYPEKRTFFLEGSDIFDFGGGSSESFMPFFSRRIGLNNGSPVPIKWGTKMYGKVGNTNIAALDVQSSGSGLTAAENMFASRISQNIFQESKVGIIATNGDPSGKKNMLIGGDFTYKTSRFMGSDNFSAGMWGVRNWNERKGGNKDAYGLKIEYPNDLFEGGIEYNFFGDSLNPGLGFLPRQAYHYLYVGGSYMPRPQKGWIGKEVRQWFFEFRMTNYWNLKGQRESREIFTAPINLRTESGEHIEFNIIPITEVLPQDFEISEGVIIPKGAYNFISYRAEFNSASYRKVQIDLSNMFGQFYSGHYDNLTAGITFKANGYANLQIGANIARGNLPQGKFSENVYLAKLNIFITPDLGINNYIQYDDVTEQMGYNGRFFWQIRPGNIIYLVYNNNMERRWNPESRFHTQEEQIRLKIQLSIRF